MPLNLTSEDQTTTVNQSHDRDDVSAFGTSQIGLAAMLSFRWEGVGGEKENSSSVRCAISCYT
jgi:hypothetical protein